LCGRCNLQQQKKMFCVAVENLIFAAASPKTEKDFFKMPLSFRRKPLKHDEGENFLQKISIYMKILIINGPNLNLLGRRQPEIYGTQTFEDFFLTLKANFPNIELHYFQSNSEGALLDKLHEVGFSFDGIVANFGAYTHTSIALLDAISGIKTPVVEVHISNIHAREPFRQHSYSGKAARGVVTGLGLFGYELALKYFEQLQQKTT
jgi:3-dehydroquinate dehydratase II